MCFLTCFSYLGTSNVQDVDIPHVLKGDGAQLFGDRLVCPTLIFLQYLYIHLKSLKDNLR